MVFIWSYHRLWPYAVCIDISTTLFATQVYTSSLIENAPVYLNGEAVRSEVLICNKDVLKVGTCSFRFEYNAGFEVPLQASRNTSQNTVGIKLFLSPLTLTLFYLQSDSSETPQKPKSPASAKRGKENVDMLTPKNVNMFSY